jgi:hypothetical protein
MKKSASRIAATATAATANHIHFADFRFCFSLTLYDENNWNGASSASRLNVAVGSGDLRIPSTLATLGKPGAAGNSSVVWRAFGLCEVRLRDACPGSLGDSFGFSEAGSGEAELKTRGISTKDAGVASLSTDCPCGLGFSMKE